MVAGLTRLTRDVEAPPTVAGSHMSLLRPATPRVPGEAGNGKPGEVKLITIRMDQLDSNDSVEVRSLRQRR